MPDNPKTPRTILLCVAGLTPQIVTETLWALTQSPSRRERVDEIHVITTGLGSRIVAERLLDPRSGKFVQFLEDFSVPAGAIRFDESTVHVIPDGIGGILEDIRTVDDNVRAADFICERVRELTSDGGTRLHASAAGGRKTMGLYLMAAMQLFGRSGDTLSHVLVNEEFEMARDFFYPPPRPVVLEVRDSSGIVRSVSTDGAVISLAEISFIKLAGLGDGRLAPTGEYSSLVDAAQQRLELAESAHDVTIDLAGHTVTVADQVVRLSPKLFFWYVLFARYRMRGPGEQGLIELDAVKAADFKDTLAEIVGDQLTVRDLFHPSALKESLIHQYEFVKDPITWIQSSKGEHRESYQKLFLQTNGKLGKVFRSREIPERYYVRSFGPRFSKRYGIDVPPERIHWKR